MMMASDTLAYRSAKKHVADFQHESDLLRAHAEAMECRDCESLLQLGIDAFEWLGRADTQYQFAMCDGMEWSPEFEAALLQLYRQWLEPCESVQQWIQSLEQRGFQVENRQRFLKCINEVTAIITPSQDMDGEMLKLRDSALDDFKHGRTSDWDRTP